jgi:hypothetical protein
MIAAGRNLGCMVDLLTPLDFSFGLLPRLWTMTASYFWSIASIVDHDCIIFSVLPPLWTMAASSFWSIASIVDHDCIIFSVYCLHCGPWLHHLFAHAFLQACPGFMNPSQQYMPACSSPLDFCGDVRS